MEKQILEILKREFSDYGDIQIFKQEALERVAKELSSLMSADLRKELIKFCVYNENPNPYFQTSQKEAELWVDLYLQSRPDSKVVTDAEIEKWAENVDLLLLNTKVNVFMSELRRGIAIGIKAHRDGLITK